MKKSTDQHAAIVDEAIEDEHFDPPNLVRKDKTPFEILAEKVWPSLLTAKERRRLGAGDPVSLIVLCEDRTAHIPLKVALHKISHATTRVFIQDRGKLQSDGLRYTSLTESLAAGFGAIAIVATLDELPRSIRAASERTINLKFFSRGIVAATIRDCNRGGVPKDLGSLDLSALDYDTICAAIGSNGLAKASVARLAKAVSLAHPVPERDHDTPVLEDAVEYGAARDWGVALKADITDYKAGKLDWKSIDRGVVLVGAPGVGKTLFARSLAQACEVPLVIASMGDFFANSDGALGGVVKRQRAAFAEARSKSPCILLLDEVNALPDIDNLHARGADWWRPVILDFYIQLDSLSADRDGVVVVGTTNRLRDINPSLLRPGRLERAIQIYPPDAEGAERIIRHHLRDLQIGGIEELGVLAAGATPAVIMDWCRTAKRIARRQGRPLIAADVRKVILAQSLRDPDEDYRICVHEAGHAVAAALVPSLELCGASVLRSAESEGSVTFCRTGGAATKATIEEEAIVLLAGRAAELIVLGEAATGSGGDAGSDLARATSLIASSFLSFGFSDAKILPWRATPDQAIALLQFDGQLRANVEKQLLQLHERVQDILSDNRDAVLRISDELRRKRRLSAGQIEALIPSSDNRGFRQIDTPSEEYPSRVGRAADL